MNEELPYSFDLLFDIKTMEELRKEVKYLEERLSNLRETMEYHGITLEGE